MGSHNENKQLHLGQFEMSQRAKSLAFASMAIGALAFIIGLIKFQDRLWTAYLVSFFFFSCLGLGGLFFVALNHVTKSGWMVTIRRFAESMTTFIPVMVIGSLILLIGAKTLFPWARPDLVAADPILQSKTAYLNLPFFIIRMLVFGIGCLIFKKVLIGDSIAQDATGDESLTEKGTTVGVGFIPFFALAFSFFSVDLMMSLLPYWYSTIFGIYCFSGLFQSFFAALMLIIIWVRRKGLVKGYVTEDHMHDVGKYLKAFTVFWAYIAFSQFMLIWYANIPEETEFFIMRAQNGWLPISLMLLVFKFIVPFIALLPKWAKRNESHLIVVSILILVMQYVDIYWLVYPNFNEGQFTFGWIEIAIFIGFFGIFFYKINQFLAKNNIVPVKDPRLHESLNHHVTY